MQFTRKLVPPNREAYYLDRKSKLIEAKPLMRFAQMSRSPIGAHVQLGGNAICQAQVTRERVLKELVTETTVHTDIASRLPAVRYGGFV